MISYLKSEYSRLSGSIDCDCGRTHKFGIRCVLERGAYRRLADFVAGFTPPLSRIALFYDDEKSRDRVYQALKREFRVTSIAATDDKKQLDLIALPEDTRLIIAAGGAEGAKYKAQICDLPLIVASLPTYSTLSPYATVKDGVYETYVVKRPEGFIYDLDIALSDRDRAAIFGTVVARLNTAFEYYVSALFAGEYCPFIAGAMSDIAAETVLKTENAKGMVVDNDFLVHAALKLSLLGSVADVPRCGETQCALAYAMLNEGDFSLGELEFIFSAVLTSLYMSHVAHRKAFVAPPDNNYRLEQIAELFGIDEYKALPMILPQLSGRAAAVIEYKLGEYSADLIEKLDKNANLFKMAFKKFKRLYADDGYSLGEFAGGDLALCFSLSPDMIKGGGMLNMLKRLGDLDRYIV